MLLFLKYTEGKLIFKIGLKYNTIKLLRNVPILRSFEKVIIYACVEIIFMYTYIKCILTNVRFLI